MLEKRNNNDSHSNIILFELHNFIYMILEGMIADSIHLIGCGLNAVSADSIHLILVHFNGVLNIPFSRCHGRSISRRFLLAICSNNTICSLHTTTQ